MLSAACDASILVPRRHPGNWVCGAARVLAGAILAGWAGKYIAEVIVGWSLGYSLPLQLTDAVSVTAILALLTRRQLFIDLLYFWAFSASLQAALTPRPRAGPILPERPLLHLFHPPRRRDRGGVPARVRLPAVPAARRDLAGLRPHALLGRPGRPRRRDHRRQLHIPAQQAGTPLAAERDGSVAVVHRRGTGLGLLMFLALRALLDAARRLDVGYRRS